MRAGEFAALVALLFTIAVSPALGGSATELSGGKNLKTKAIVDHVSDGDTVVVEIGGREETVRFIGIDTPEVYETPECGGEEASAEMKRMLQPGDRVKLIRDRSQDNRDVYGRLLRYVVLGKRDLGQAQVQKGWARVYLYDEPFDRLSTYDRAEGGAQAGGRGVWGLCGDFES